MRKIVCFLLVLGMITSFGMNVSAQDEYDNTNNDDYNQTNYPIDDTKDNQNNDYKDDEGDLNNQKEQPEEEKQEEQEEQLEPEDVQNVSGSVNSNPVETVEPKLTYSTHVQDLGWMDYVNDGIVSGTEGKSKRLEAIKINLISGSYQGDISYKTHVQDLGWMDLVNNDQISGTEGKSKRLEAIKIQLSGDIANYYDVYYRVHIQDKGWLDWASNGQPAGSESYGYRLEAIEIRLVKKGEQAPTNTESPFIIPGNVYYSAHVQDKGWLQNVGDGIIGGTTDQRKRLEAIKIYLNDAIFNGNIEYSTHVQYIGWTQYVTNGDVSGTVGQNKQVEAIKIRLTGEIAQKYDLYYRVHIQEIGWLDWAKNDEVAGSEGFSYRMEAIQIQLVPKGADAPGDTSRPNLTFGNIEYQTHMQGDGWINTVSNGITCGTIGQSKRMEAFKVTLGNNQFSGNIEYSSHVQDIGWMDYVANGEVSGTEGQSKRIEALKIRLSGEVANYYDVYYRVYAQDFGWLGWTCNDRVAGTTNGSFRLEAIQIKLYPKNTGPGVDKKSVINFVADGNYKVCQDAFGNIYTDAEPLLGKRSGYTVFTNLSTNIVNVFMADGTGKEIITFKRYQCTSGAPSTPTIRGTYYIYMKRYYFDSGAARCFYFSPFKGGYGFHTVLCYKDPTPSRIMDGRLGMYLSHGCIRLAIENAKWIYDNCSIGTKVINL